MAPIVDEKYRQMCEQGGLEAFCWYPLRNDVKGGGHRVGHRMGTDFEYRGTEKEMNEAVTKLVAHIKSVGGVDGIVGFSQGGELAYLLAEAIPAAAKPRVKFIATFGSEDVFLERGRPPRILCPSLHFFLSYGSEDLECALARSTAFVCGLVASVRLL